MDPQLISRRALLAGTAFAAAAADDKAPKSKLKVAIFSKHLQFLQGEELARSAQEIGFDGIDITVRKGGHVEPERVRQDLPGLVAVIRRAGLEVPMVTTDIVDVSTPHIEDILKTMQDLGIRYYRWDGLKYEPRQPYAAQLEQLKPRVARLAALNARYGACGMYHTHSGKGRVGASIWDLYLLLRDIDPHASGVNYDVGHANVEGGDAGWINSFRIVQSHVRGLAIKDFLWEKNAKGLWQAQWKPLGEGMVRFKEFFPMVADAGFSGPVQLHFEYPLGGANDGKTVLQIGKEQVFAAMKRDLSTLRSYLAQANL